MFSRKHRKKKVKRMAVLLLVLCLVSGMVTPAAASWNTAKTAEGNSAGTAVTTDLETAASSDEVSVSITNSYVSIGTTITVQTEGYPEGSSLQYKWTVGGVDTGSSGDSYTPSEDDAEKWIQVTVSCAGYEDQSDEIYFSELPVMYLDFDLDAVIADKTTYVDGSMTLQGNSTYTSSSQLYSGALEVKGRGNTSWNADKKPFKLKLDSKTNLLGMGKNKHWVLLANATEGSMMRNNLAYKLSGLWGLTYQDGTWVEVVINGEYYGTYYLCEHVRVGSTRVDIEDLADAAEDAAKAVVKAGLLSDADGLAEAMEEDLSWISSDSFTYNGVTFTVSDYYAYDKDQLTSGGFLFELDAYYDEVSKFRSSLNQPIMFNTPEYANTNQDMMDYAEEFINAFEASIQSADFQTTYDGETVSSYDLFDFDSLVSYWMIQELFMNEDGMKKSTYFYKDQDTEDGISKMFMGPVWDMDWSSDGEGGGDYTAWQTVYYNDGAQTYQWYKYLCQDPYFLTKAREFYWEHRSEILDMVASIYGEAENDIFTDNAYSYLYDAAVANESLWGAYKLGYDGEVEKLYTWLNNRISWLDKNMSTIDTVIDSMGLYEQDESIGLTVTDGVLSIAASDGALATVRINGAVVGTVTLTNGAGSFDAGSMLTEEQDVIHVIIYDAKGNSLGSNFCYDQEEELGNVIALSIVTLPRSTVYTVGDELSLYGMEVLAIYENGSAETVPNRYLTVIGYDGDTAGTQEITVTYEGVSASLTVYVLNSGQEISSWDNDYVDIYSDADTNGSKTMKLEVWLHGSYMLYSGTAVVYAGDFSDLNFWFVTKSGWQVYSVKYRDAYGDENSYEQTLSSTSGTFSFSGCPVTDASGGNVLIIDLVAYDEPECTHDETYLSGTTGATCTEDGYTGDLYCLYCNKLLEEGNVIQATGHSYEMTETRSAACEEDGYTTYTCSVCSDSFTETIPATGHSYVSEITTEATCTEDGIMNYTCSVCGDSYTEATPATGHSWDNGVVTKEATTEEEGEMTYTCTVCGETKTEVIEKLPKELSVPSVSLTVTTDSSGHLVLTGTYEEYADADDYYPVTAHGLVYYSTTKLGNRVLTVNTSGRTRVNFSKYASDGSFTYKMTPANKNTKYTIRAFLAYTDANGKTVYVYSDAVSVTYNGLAAQ